MWQLPWITIQNFGCPDSRGIRSVGYTVSTYLDLLIMPTLLKLKLKILFFPTLWLKLRGVLGHFTHPQNRPWTKCTDEVHPLLAELVGRL